MKKLEERGIVIRFVIGRSHNRGDSLDRKIDQENRATKDFLIFENHEEAQEELPKTTPRAQEREALRTCCVLGFAICYSGDARSQWNGV